jgi:hypothetical protein
MEAFSRVANLIFDAWRPADIPAEGPPVARLTGEAAGPQMEGLMPSPR